MQLFGWTVCVNDCPRVDAAFAIHRGRRWFCLHFARNVLWGWRGNAGFNALWAHWFGVNSLRVRVARMNTTYSDTATNIDWTL